MNTAEIAIDVQGLSKRFADHLVVDQVDLHVARGQIYGFLGPNGSGKTTTIRMLCGLLKPDAGQGTCLGYDILRESESIKPQVGYMTQKFGLYEDLSIAENLDFIARVYQVEQRRTRVAQVLEQLGLVERQRQLAGALSGGWKQRLALAACLLHNPQLLLLDEPTAGVDPQARRIFWDQIHDLAAQGLTVLVSTHYMDEAERCHKLAYIFNGKLLVHGTVAEVIESAGLFTWAIHGPGLVELGRRLRQVPGIRTAARFGNALHVGAYDAAALEHAIPAEQKAQLHIESIQPSLEDVFIALMQQPAVSCP